MFEPTAQVIRNRVRQADRDVSRRDDGLTSAARAKIRQPWREVQQLRLEREILAKAAAWFARKTDAISPKSSSS